MRRFILIGIRFSFFRRKTRKTLTVVELRRSARKPWRHLNPLYYTALAKTLSVPIASLPPQLQIQPVPTTPAAAAAIVAPPKLPSPVANTTPLSVAASNDADVPMELSTSTASLNSSVTVTKDIIDSDVVAQSAAETPVAPADLSAPTTNATSTTPTKAESAASGNAGDLQCVILED